MTAELLSRVQFALTASFHFIFPPISMGLGIMLLVMGVLYWRTQDPKWRQLSFFWVKIYGIVFAMGVATGIRFMPRPDCNVVNMPNISPAMVGRETMTKRYCPALLVMR